MWGCHGGWKRKRWNYVESSGHIRIGKKLCLSAPYPHKAGSPVHVAPCSGHALSRSWRYYKSGQIATRTTGLCLSSKHARVNGGHVYLWHCSPHSAPQRWHVHSGRATHGSFSSTPGAVHELYMYRAAPIGVMGKYPFGDINLGNLEGVMWYLNHEVATSSLPWLPTKFQPRCPRKFSIALIYRFKVKIKTTPAMVKKGLNFGTRFAYDAGKCSGRCFWNNMCTCGHDCAHQYHKYGYVPGCNNFLDHYPYPTPHTADQATEGIWYSLPEEGRCSHPTGSHTCTWSYEHAGVISVKDLEEQHPGGSNCCNGRCTYFWDHQLSTKRTKWRVKQALNLFHKKFPHEPKELHHSFCDFHHNRWYQSDPYPRQDGYTCPR